MVTRDRGFDVGRDLLCVADAGGRFTSLNRAWEQVLGWSREELMSRPFMEFVHPDDVTATIAAASNLNTADYELAEFENRYRTPTGEYRWLHWSARSDGETWFAVAFDVSERREREEELRMMLREDRLLAYSQPILDQRRLKITHEELLARMRGRHSGEVMLPESFVPDAERLGLIGIVDCWMLHRALEVAASGRTATVNLSADSIGDPTIQDEMCAAVEASNGGARHLILEITETAAVAHLDAALDLTARLEPLGCRFALDDFGTGYGSLTYLRRLPVQFLKIDTSFVRRVTRNRDDQALVRSVVAIASELGLRTVAEGVEDGPTFQLLREYSVDHVQGYLIGRPEPVMN